MTTFDELGTFEYETYSDGEGDGLPRLNWHNGDPKSKTPGDFYTRAESWVGDMPEPWHPVDRFDGEPGYAAPALRILPITYRSQPFRKVERGGQMRREYLTKWEEGASVHTEILCLVDGLEGPVVWSVKGSIGKAVTGKGGIFPSARTALVLEAEKRLKKKVPMHAFWLPIATQLDASGKVFYLKFEQGGSVTPPALRLPKLDGSDLLNALYAGRATIEDAAALREQYEGWRLEKRTNRAEEPVEAPPAATGRNVPQPIGNNPVVDANGEIVF